MKKKQMLLIFAVVIILFGGVTAFAADKPNLLLIDNTDVGRAISDLFRQEGMLFNPS